MWAPFCDYWRGVRSEHEEREKKLSAAERYEHDKRHENDVSDIERIEREAADNPNRGYIIDGELFW